MHAIDVTDEEWQELGRLSDAFRRRVRRADQGRGDRPRIGMVLYRRSVQARSHDLAACLEPTMRRVREDRSPRVEGGRPKESQGVGRKIPRSIPRESQRAGPAARSKAASEVPEQIRLANKAAFDKNRAKFYVTQRLYAKNNPDIIRAANAAYRARKRTAVGTLTAAEFSAILERQKHRCHWCGDSIKTGSQIDHVIPLVRGGEHSAANVVGSCGLCNRRKRSKDPILWANELGRLF